MKSYNVEIRENRIYMVEVEADSFEEARHQVKAFYDKGLIENPNKTNVYLKIIMKGETPCE